MSPEPMNVSHDMAERALADIIQVMYLRIGKLSWIFQLGSLYSHEPFKVSSFLYIECRRNVVEERIREIQRLRKTLPTFATWKTLEGIGTVFMKTYLLIASKTLRTTQEKTRNWVQPSTKMSLKANYFPEPPEHTAVLPTPWFLFCKVLNRYKTEPCSTWSSDHKMWNN